MFLPVSSHQAQNTSEFIRKLIEIMQAHPQMIEFSKNGKQVVIHDQQSFSVIILPKYFRHSQWKSFIRQMNMYNFRKLNRGPSVIIFSNPHFFVGNQSNYHLIKRKIHVRDEDSQEIMGFERRSQKILELDYSQTTLPIFINKIINFRNQVTKCTGSIKKALDFICKERKTNELKHKSGLVKDGIQMIDQSALKLADCQFKHSQLEGYAHQFLSGDSDSQQKSPESYFNSRKVSEKKINEEEFNGTPSVKQENLIEGNEVREDKVARNDGEQLQLYGLQEFPSLTKFINL